MVETKSKRLDPKARIELSGSAFTGRVGSPDKCPGFIKRDDFDLDILVQTVRRISEDGLNFNIDEDEAAGLDKQIDDLTSKIHDALSTGDPNAVKSFSEQRDQSIVGRDGRAS